MKKNKIPTYYCHSLYEINLSKLDKLKKKILLIDVDNTFIPFNKEEPSFSQVSFIKNLIDRGYNVIFLSNNSFKRVFKAVSHLKCGFIARANKPFINKTKRYLEKYQIDKKDCLIIGDQIYSDIKTANKLNIDSLLVDPLIKQDLLVTKLNRGLDLLTRKKLRKLNLLKEI